MFEKKKKQTNSLQSDFFEKVVDLELQLAKEFDIVTLQELTRLYKEAIEYYESIGDPKFIDYNNRLNNMLSRKDVLKYINKDRNKRANSHNNKKVPNRTNLMVNVNFADNSRKVKDVIRQNDSLNRSKDLIIDDISKQENSFKMRLEEKRKNKLSTSYIQEDKTNNSFLNKSGANLFQDDNKSQNFDFEDNSIVCQILGTPKGFAGQAFDNFDNVTEQDTVSRITAKKDGKHHKFVDDLKERIGEFLQKFNDYFNDNIFQEYTATVQKLMEDKYKKYLEISNYYDVQIKEMELLLKEAEEEHKPSILDIISNFKSELESSLEKNEQIHQVLLKDTYEKFHKLGFKDNKGVKGIEVAFEVEIYNMVHNILAAS